MAFLHLYDFDTKAKGKMMQPMNVFLQVILHEIKNQQKGEKSMWLWISQGAFAQSVRFCTTSIP